MTDNSTTGQRLIEQLAQRLNYGGIDVGDWLLYELAIMAEENRWVKERVFGWLEQFRKQDLEEEEAAERAKLVATYYEAMAGLEKNCLSVRDLLDRAVQDIKAYEELYDAP